MAGNIPQPVSANVRVPVEAAAQQGRAGNAIAQGVAALAGSAEQAGNRIRTRREVVDKVRAVDAYRTSAMNEYRRLATEADISDPKISEQFAMQLRDQQDQLLNEWQGSPESKVALFEDINQFRSNLVDQVAVDQIAEGRRRIGQDLTGFINNLSTQAYEDPSQIMGLVRDAEDRIAQYAPGLSPEEEDVYRMSAGQLIIGQAVTRMLDSGEVDGAEEALAKPGVSEIMDPATMRQIRTRINTQRKANNQAQLEAQQDLQYAATMLGKPVDQLSASERMAASRIKFKENKTFSDVIADAEAFFGGPLSEDQIGSIYTNYQQKMGMVPSGNSFGDSLSGRTMNIMTNEAPAFAAGLMDPQEERRFLAAVTQHQQPQRDPITGMVTTPGLPPFVDDALKQRGYRWDTLSGKLLSPGEMSMSETAQSNANQQLMSAQLPADQTVWGMASNVAGVGPAAVEVLGRSPVGGENMENHAVSQSLAKITMYQKELVRALHNNQRYPETERQAIEEDISIDNKIWDNPASYRNRLIGIDDALSLRQDYALNMMNDPLADRQTRIDARNIFNLLVDFRNKLGIPPRINSPEEAMQLAPGSLFIAPDGTTKRVPEQGNQ